MSGPAPLDGLVEVRLVGLPLAVYRDSSEHHDELRREFALIAAGETSATTSVPARLVALIDALQVRFGTFTAQPTEALQRALERGDDRIDLVYRVPPEAKEAAWELDALLDEADEFCRQGEHLLTLATPAPAAALRRWFLSEFAAQIDGAAPMSWDDWNRAGGSPTGH
ncbi:MAG: hypothetical protein M3179_09625 [Actinomycetota bacterium]|nr:hypothetical protein [Actinomycetota bacterium]